MDKNKVTKIFTRLTKAIPEPKTELYYTSDFELLIAVILSAHSTDVGVNKATDVLFKIANTPQTMLVLGEKKLKRYIKNVGLYNTKAANIIKTCAILVNKYHSKIPAEREALEELPGVGRKTANVILNVIFGMPTIAVDTHIFRVSNRTKIAQGKTPLTVEEQLLKVIPNKYLKNAHYLLLLHGRYVCKAKMPLCKECAICDLCEYEHKVL